MNYRRAGQDDIAQLTTLRMAYLEADHGVLEAEIYETIAQRLPSYFLRHLERDCFAYVAEAEDGELIASALLVVSEKPANLSFPTGRIGTVLNVYTQPQYRRQGNAEVLMRMLMYDASAMELDYIELKATEQGAALYEKLGFCPKNSDYLEMQFIF